jgi:hypothetical protein
VSARRAPAKHFLEFGRGRRSVQSTMPPPSSLCAEAESSGFSLSRLSERTRCQHHGSGGRTFSTGSVSLRRSVRIILRDARDRRCRRVPYGARILVAVRLMQLSRAQNARRRWAFAVSNDVSRQSQRSLVTVFDPSGPSLRTVFEPQPPRPVVSTSRRSTRSRLSTSTPGTGGRKPF